MDGPRQLSDAELAARAGVPLRSWQRYTEPELIASDDGEDIDVVEWTYGYKVLFALDLAQIMGGRRMFVVIH
jgi:hypothetical protein